jgi:hypothetical protein
MMLFDTSLDGTRWGRGGDPTRPPTCSTKLSINKALRHYGVEAEHQGDLGPPDGSYTSMTSFMAQLDALKERQIATALWLAAQRRARSCQSAFAYGGRIHTSNGGRVPGGATPTGTWRSFYKPKGDEQGVVGAACTHRHRTEPPRRWR